MYINIPTHENRYLVGPDKLSDPWTALFLAHQQGICNNLSSTPLAYIRKVHQNTSRSVVSELMRFIHHIITYIVPAAPRGIHWARPLIQKLPVTGWAGAMKPPKTPVPTGVHLCEKNISGQHSILTLTLSATGSPWSGSVTSLPLSCTSDIVSN